MARRDGGGVEPRPVDPSREAAVAEAWARAHAAGPCAGDAAAPRAASDGRHDAWLVEHEGRVVGVGAVRTWGRVGHVHALHVADEARRRGVGAALLEALLGELERRDAAVVGLEVDGAGAAALTLLARAGFKPMHLSFALERAAGPDPGGEEPLVPLSGPQALEALAHVAPLAQSVDADLDPTDWLRDRLHEGSVDLALVPAAAGRTQPSGFVVLPRGTGPDVLAASLVVVDEGAPHEGLSRVAAGLAALARARGAGHVQVPGPSRYWDATRTLLELGFRPRASFLRLLRRGYPERGDAGRAHLACWR